MISARRAREADLDKAVFSLSRAGAIYLRTGTHFRAGNAPRTPVAIGLYLGERTGKSLPKRVAGRIPVYEWLMWQMGGFGPMPGQVHHFIALENEQERAYGLKRFMAETRRLYGVLDRRLADRDFRAGPPSSADFPLLGGAVPHPPHKRRPSRFPHC